MECLNSPNHLNGGLTVYTLTGLSLPGSAPMPLVVMQEQMSLFSLGICCSVGFQAFFVGKVNEGTFAAGFKYSAMIVLTAHISLAFSQSLTAACSGWSHKLFGRLNVMPAISIDAFFVCSLMVLLVLSAMTATAKLLQPLITSSLEAEAAERYDEIAKYILLNAGKPSD